MKQRSLVTVQGRCADVGQAPRLSGQVGTAVVHANVVIRKMHQTIDAVTRRMERFEFNTAISALMELSNAIGDHLAANGDIAAAREAYTALLQMLHPFAPHVTEEMWQQLDQTNFAWTWQ